MKTERLSNDDARLIANTLRFLAADAVQQANSGHPGMPMGAADYAAILWHEFLRFDPEHPDWPDRDRFVLSAGHGSMLLYGLLHIYGFDLPMEELQRFRQLGSRTPGHPEYGHTPGVETTTGPLGQGFANGVGMALAGKMAAERFNTDGAAPVSYRVFGIVGDGDLMEGISSEAASLAGHLKLGNLIYLYDDNQITIEGSTTLAWSEDVAARFSSCGWHVQTIDGHDYAQIRGALLTACYEGNRPSLIICRTTIAKGSPTKEGSESTHGSPLGAEEIAATRRNLGWDLPPFQIPERVLELCRDRIVRQQQGYRAWKRVLAKMKKEFPAKGALWDQMTRREIPAILGEELLAAVKNADGATRVLSGKALNRAARLIPSLIGGSADLAPSNNSWIEGESGILPNSYGGRNIHYGVREHAMAAVMNGLALSGFFIPFGATFLSFADYCRPSIRLSALMKLPVTYIFTHDSIFLGEDGPTHQPIEQLASLRLIPGLRVIRPADGIETAIAWELALERKDGPTALILTRQKVSPLSRGEEFTPADVKRGGYVVRRGGETPDVVFIASGSEVGLAVAAADELAESGIAARVVSIPCLELFLSQPGTYRKRVIPGKGARVVIEAGRSMPWWQLAGPSAIYITIETFGLSAPEKDLARHFGFTPSQVAERVRRHLGR